MRRGRLQRQGFGCWVDPVVFGLAALFAISSWATVAPPVTNNLLIALDGSTALTSGSAVTNWLDQAGLGGGQNFLQNTAGNRPTLAANQTMPSLAVQNVVSFSSGSSQYLELLSDSTMNTNTFTWFIVFKPATIVVSAAPLIRSGYASGASVGADRLWGSYVALNNADVADIFCHTRRADGQFVCQGFDAAAGNWYVMSAVWNGSSALLNGNSATSLAVRLFDQWSQYIPTPLASLLTNQASANPSGHINTRIGGDNSPLYFNGQIAEVLVYNTALSSSDRSGVEQYCLQKYLWRPADLPPVTSNLLVCVNGSLVSTSGTAVVSWYDQSPLGGYEDFGQSTPANRPTLLANQIMPSGAARNVVGFNRASQQYLELLADGNMNTNTFSWFLVFKPNTFDPPASMLLRSGYSSGAAAGSSVLWGSYVRTNDIGTADIFSQTRRSDASFVAQGFDASPNRWYVMSAVWNGAATSVNGNSATSLVANLTDDANKSYTVAASVIPNQANANPSGHTNTRIGGDNTPYYFDGQIAEVLIYGTALSATDVGTVQQHLARRYLAPSSGVLIQLR